MAVPDPSAIENSIIICPGGQYPPIHLSKKSSGSCETSHSILTKMKSVKVVCVTEHDVIKLPLSFFELFSTDSLILNTY